MKLFELKPVEDQENSHHWKASMYKGCARVCAQDSQRARTVAGLNFSIASKRIPGQEIATNPWKLEQIVSCVEISDPDIVLGDNEQLIYPKIAI